MEKLESDQDDKERERERDEIAIHFYCTEAICIDRISLRTHTHKHILTFMERREVNEEGG